MFTQNGILLLAALVILGGFIYSIVIIKRQEKKKLDEDISPVLVRHKLWANPIVIGFGIGFLIIVGYYVFTFIRG